MNGIWLSDGCYVPDLSNISVFCIGKVPNGKWLPSFHLKGEKEGIPFIEFEPSDEKTARKNLRIVVERMQKQIHTTSMFTAMDSLLEGKSDE